MELNGPKPIHYAVVRRDAEAVRRLVAEGADAREGVYPHRDATSPLTLAREHGFDDIVNILLESEHSRPAPMPAESRETLWHYAGSGEYAKARALLEGGADPNAVVFASGSPMFQAFSEGDTKMIALLQEFGAVIEPSTAALFRHTELARQLLTPENAEEILWGATCGGDPEAVRIALELIPWERDDSRWFRILEQPLRIWRYGSVAETWDRSTYPKCFRLLLDRCDPNLTARFGITILHSVAGSRNHVTPDERVAFATMLLDAGARRDIRDDLLRKTAPEWAERWQRGELLDLFAAR
jgi:ankyrin repeat protein